MEAAQAAMTAALDDFAKNKKSVLPLRFFQDLARHRPAVTAPLLSHLAELAAKPRSAFKRAELLSLLASWTACPAVVLPTCPSLPLSIRSICSTDLLTSG